MMKMDKIVIPKIYTEVSTSKVLVSDFIDGMSLEAYLNSNPSQESKDEYAQLIFDSFFYSLYHLGRIHADPNPANFLFMDDGKLAMIDFGCIKKIDDDFLKGYNALHLALIEDVSDDEIMEHYIKFGMITKDTHENMLDFYREIIRPLDRFYIEPLSCESYDFGLHNDFSKRGFETIFEVHKKQYHSVHQLNEEYLFLDRTLLGYYAMFEKMKAKIDTKFVKGLMKQKKGVSHE
jgi:predicted unusual protein kinase regulating ubiquinone biosynthesis (AarF/ABC1/UbiB family)